MGGIPYTSHQTQNPFVHAKVFNSNQFAPGAWGGLFCSFVKKWELLEFSPAFLGAFCAPKSMASNGRILLICKGLKYKFASYAPITYLCSH